MEGFFLHITRHPVFFMPFFFSPYLGGGTPLPLPRGTEETEDILPTPFFSEEKRSRLSFPPDMMEFQGHFPPQSLFFPLVK